MRWWGWGEDGHAVPLSPAAEDLLGDELPYTSTVVIEQFLQEGNLRRIFAAILVEPVLANAGCLLPEAGYLPALADCARRHGALVIADEIWTALGRTGITPPSPPSPIITIESPIRTSRCIPPPPPRVLNVSVASNACTRKATSPSPGTRMYGVTVENPSRTAGFIAVVVIVVLR